MRENDSKELDEKNEPSERVRRYPEIQKHVIEWGYLIGILRCGELAPAQAPILFMPGRTGRAADFFHIYINYFVFKVVK